MVRKVFTSLQELLDFDLCKLDPSCSNYLILEPENGLLPVANRESLFREWRVISCLDRPLRPKITLEITPEWLTIIVYDGKTQKKQDINIRAIKKDPLVLIQQIFVIG